MVHCLEFPTIGHRATIEQGLLTVLGAEAFSLFPGGTVTGKGIVFILIRTLELRQWWEAV